MEKNNKAQWGSNFGFIMAAVGSAVGLGNLWGFPYKMGANGGFAFLLVYLVLTFFVGFAIMMCEIALGRKTGKSQVAAYETLGKKYAFLGWFATAAPFLIMGFYTVLGGYTIKYAIANIADLFGAGFGVGGADSATYFTDFYTNQVESTVYTIIFVLLTVLIVRAGVAKGIEKFTKIAMPALFFMLLIVIVRSVTLPGALDGIKFMFAPSFEPFEGMGWLKVLSTAGGQMFFSLSLGMGAMITYGSYVPKTSNIQKNSIIIPIADTMIAIMAGLAIMPAVFAAGLEPAAGPGLMFVTLQTVFDSLGAIGPIFGFIFYTLVFIAAITSAISLLEAVSATIMDKREAKGKPVKRTTVVYIVSLLIAALATLVSVDGLGSNGLPQILGQGSWLDTLDLLSEYTLMPLGALIMSIVFGWIKPDYLDDEIRLGGSYSAAKFVKFSLKWIAPPILFLVLLGSINGPLGLGLPI